jgi:uncharacterized protein
MSRLDTVPDTRSTPERQLAVFLAAAFGLSWGTGYLTVAVLDLGALGLGLGALVPGVVALALTRRDHGSVRPLWRQMTRWRVAPRWYAAAVGIPIALVAAATFVSTRFGADPAEVTLIGGLAYFPMMLLLAGGPEEPGWRGYALPRLQHRLNALAATMVLGCVWALWHAPLWFIAESGYAGMSYPAYFTLTVGQSVIYTWLFNSTGGNVLLAMIFPRGHERRVAVHAGGRHDAVDAGCSRLGRRSRPPDGPRSRQPVGLRPPLCPDRIAEGVRRR